jgi:hypothetical protein
MTGLLYHLDIGRQAYLMIKPSVLLNLSGKPFPEL